MSVGKISTTSMYSTIVYYAKYEQHAANTGYISNLLKSTRTLLFVPFLGTPQNLLLQFITTQMWVTVSCVLMYFFDVSKLRPEYFYIKMYISNLQLIFFFPFYQTCDYQHYCYNVGIWLKIFINI